MQFLLNLKYDLIYSKNTVNALEWWKRPPHGHLSVYHLHDSCIVISNKFFLEARSMETDLENLDRNEPSGTYYIT